MVSFGNLLDISNQVLFQWIKTQIYKDYIYFPITFPNAVFSFSSGFTDDRESEYLSVWVRPSTLSTARFKLGYIGGHEYTCWLFIGY